MKTNKSRVATLTALAVALLATACDNQLGPDADHLLTPATASLAKKGKGGGTGNKGELQLISATESSVSGTITHYAVIDKRGGEVGDHAYGLRVAPNAVKEPTLFVIGAATRPELSGKIAISATATSCHSGDADYCFSQPHTNNVGGDGFATPVTVSLGFNPGGGPPKWRGVTIVWVRPDEVLEPLTTRVMMAQKELRANTDHFSDFALAWP